MTYISNYLKKKKKKNRTILIKIIDVYIQMYGIYIIIIFNNTYKKNL